LKLPSHNDFRWSKQEELFSENLLQLHLAKKRKRRWLAQFEGKEKGHGVQFPLPIHGGVQFHRAMERIKKKG
jgi:hypothetical protein